MSKETHVSDYEVLEEIGSGMFGRVMKIKHRTKGTILAWKEIHYKSMDDKEKILIVNEVNLLRELRFPLFSFLHYSLYFLKDILTL